METKLNELNIKYKLITHNSSGKTTEQAEKALNEKKENIIKSILLKNEKEEYLGIILLGNSKIDFSKLKNITNAVFNYKNNKFSFCPKEKVKEVLGYEIEGVPPIAFFIKNIPTIIDSKVITQEYVIGAGGNEYTGLKLMNSEIKKIPGKIMKISKI